MDSSQHRPNNPDLAVHTDWERNCATGVAFDVMLTNLFPETNPSVSCNAFSSSRRAELSMMLSQQEQFAEAANSMLRQYYDQHPPAQERPAVIFVPFYASVIEGDRSIPQTTVLAILRDEWARKLCLSEWRNSSIERLKDLFPCMQWEDPSIRALLHKEVITMDDLNVQTLSALGASPPLDHVVAIVGLNFDTLSSEKSQSSSRVTLFETSSSTTAPLSELPQYFRQLMTSTRYRDWASGAFVNNGRMSLVSHDREGAVQSAWVHLQTPEGFRLFSRWILSVGSRTLEQWGFSSDFGPPGSRIEGATFNVPEQAKSESEGTIQLKFGKQRHQPNCLFGPGTLYNVDVTTGKGTTKGVCKISWPVLDQGNVHCLIQQAQMIDPVHVPEVTCAWYIDKSDLPSRKLRPHCVPTVSNWQKRVLRIVLLPIYRPIYELEGEEFLAAFWDVMRCAVKLYEARSVHHYRNLSVNNMVYYRDKHSRVVGMLSDFDLVTHRSGAAPFMALELLEQKGDCRQKLEHDFESALYILLWVALGYKGWKPPNGDPLSDWRRGTWGQIYTAKSAFIDSTVIIDLVDLITPGYEVLRKRIQLLYMEIRQRKQRKDDEVLLQAMGKTQPATPPVTAQEFFDVIGPTPPGHEPYCQIKS